MKTLSVIALGAVLIATSCTSPAPPKEAEKKVEAPIEPVTGLTGIYRCYGPTRQWAQDIQILRAESLLVANRPQVPGKAYAWRVTFVSPSKSRLKYCTYSVVKDDGLFEGVYNPNDEAWRGPTKQAVPFVVQAAKTDTDEIYRVALEKSKDYAAKNPDVPITMLLEFTDRNPVAAWRVAWGPSVASAAYSVFVDATNGTYLKKAF